MASPEVFQECLRLIRRVFDEAEDGDEHLDDLQRLEVGRPLHVLHAQRDAALVWKRTAAFNVKSLLRRMITT